MTLLEFSSEFDLLLNQELLNKPFGKPQTPLQFSEYEKSVFLTLALDEFVINAYAGRLLGYGSYEETEELTKFLSALNKTVVLYANNSATLDINNKCFTYPTDMLYNIYQKVENGGLSYKISDITHDEYEFLKGNPFRGQLSNRVLALDKNNNEVELIPPIGIEFGETTKYTVRYIINPPPIILVDLSNLGAKIKNLDAPSNCILHEVTHPLILKLAVLKAAQTYKVLV